MGRTTIRNRHWTAKTADPHSLYQLAVQSPESDIEIFERFFARHRKRPPLRLREDFCGTGYLASRWVRSAPDRRAVGVDLDRPTLDWGRARNLHEPKIASRVELHCADVLEIRDTQADITCAMNFSFCVFKTREQLRQYFANARAGLADDGILVFELYGGTEAIIELEEEREVDASENDVDGEPTEDFTFVWDQERFNPITHETLCHIHFQFEDGSRLERAFTYDWRLWTLPEVREVLAEVGFQKVEVYWEAVDEDGDGTGEYHLTEEEENQEGWLVYVVAVK